MAGGRFAKIGAGDAQRPRLAGHRTVATDGELTDHLAAVLAVRYASALSGWNGKGDGRIPQKIFAPCVGRSGNIVELRGAPFRARCASESSRRGWT